MKSNGTIAVIGAGASGLCAAVEALRMSREANGSLRVVLLEAMPRVGKKILITGNGRCNLSNSDLSSSNFFGDRELAEKVLKRFGGESTLSFFSSLGLFTKKDFTGRIYPMSNQASAVLDVLRFECERLGAKILTSTKAEKIQSDKNSYIINDDIHAERIIISTGGCAQSVHGSDGSGFSLIKSLGVEINPVFPSLTPLCVKDFTKGLKGIRSDGSITVKCSGRMLAYDCGEIQYTDYGLSGIPAMQVSRSVSEHFALNLPGEINAYIDRAPFLPQEELVDYIRTTIKRRPLLACGELLTGIMPKRLGVTVLTEASINTEKPLKTINDGAVAVLAKSIKNKKYILSGVLGFNDAQITAGGVSGNEIEYDSMSLKKHHGIYVCGEIVDVDGRCGGYNLQWAWSSGRLAGMSAAKSLL